MNANKILYQIAFLRNMLCIVYQLRRQGRPCEPLALRVLRNVKVVELLGRGPGSIALSRRLVCDLRLDEIRPSLQHVAPDGGIFRVRRLVRGLFGRARERCRDDVGRLVHREQVGLRGTPEIVQNEMLDIQSERLHRLIERAFRDGTIVAPDGGKHEGSAALRLA